MQRADERLLHGLQCRGEPARGAQHRLTIRVGHRATVEGGTGRQGAPPAAPQPARSAQHTFRTTLPEGTGARHASSTARRPHRRWRRLPSLRYDGRQRCGEPLRPALPAPPGPRGPLLEPSSSTFTRVRGERSGVRGYRPAPVLPAAPTAIRAVIARSPARAVIWTIPIMFGTTRLRASP